ncbi:MAG: LysR family transcriptional regulator, partial [Brevibacterium sp.]|nr:LysR family transcriptional regulator [Brevibacterium sp.]
MMNLQQFRVLLAIRDEGSLNRAAEVLDHGVPTVTHHLRTLESHLRIKLVDRSRNGTRLTPLGESFAEEIEPVLARIDRA